MWILIISLIVLALVAATAGIIRNRKLQKKIDRGELDAMPEVQEVETEASGEQLAKEAKEKEAQAKAEEEKKKLEEHGFTRLPDWKDALGRYLKEIQ